ncbi:uncharacterized protein LOC143265697 [Megachile rotundata]|uniref:uncharacterized protein LOC143265697 n=1 Tax=Megachile rotundata TaxID=143995 RepID=UPI003FCF4A5F
MNEFGNDFELSTTGQLLNDSLCDSHETYSNNTCKDARRKGLIFSYRFEDFSFFTATQLVIFLIFIFGIFFAVLIYCKNCTRGARRYSQDSERNLESNENSLQYCTLRESRDRPPSYSEACSAPPLYTAPFNRISMLEPPPVYPETPKTFDRKSVSENQGFPTTSYI